MNGYNFTERVRKVLAMARRMHFDGGDWFEQRFPGADDVIAFLRSFRPPTQS